MILNKRQADLLDGMFKYLLLNLLETQQEEFDKITWQFVVVLRNNLWDNLRSVTSISFSLKYVIFYVHVQEYWICYIHKYD